MLTVGYGISFDVEHLAYAAFDQDQTNESHELLEHFSGSRYFGEHPDIASEAELDHRLKSGELKLALQIPTNFGKDLLTDKRPELSVWLDGAMPFRAETANGYVQGLAQTYLTDQAARGHIAGLRPLPVNLEARFKYNQAFKSVYQTIPSTIMLVLILIPAMMTAVGVAREKETGSIANFRSTPITGIEFLLGKQLPYVAIGLASFMTLLLVAIYLFGVPVKGSVAALLAGVFVYIGAATGFGLLVSCFTSTQIAAIFTTTILTLIDLHCRAPVGENIEFELRRNFQRFPGHDPRYAALSDEELPRAESLKDTVARFLPYWDRVLVPQLRSGRTVLVSAHGNSLRALVKYLDRIADNDIPGLEIPTGAPLVCELDRALRPIEHHYLEMT